MGAMIAIERVLWLCLLLTVPSTTGFQCTNNKVGDCNCNKHPAYQWEIFCPSYTDSNVHLKYEPTKYIELVCQRRDVSEVELVRSLAGLELGDIQTIKLSNCPVPVEPLRSWLTALGVENLDSVKWLQYSNAAPSSQPQFEGYHFQNLTGLEKIDLKRAALKHITKAFFEEITQVKSVDLANNRGVRIDGSSLADLTQLVDFQCNSCGLDTIEANLFSGLTTLKHISLHYNKISTLQPGTFDSQIALETLVLDYNKLQTLPDNIFDKMEKLESVSLSKNNFTTFPENLFKFNKKFKKFEMTQNGDCLPFYGCPLDRLTSKLSFSESMFHGSTVETIEMLWVPSNGLPNTFLKECRNLVTFKIQSALIKTLPEDLFKDTKAIKLIDLSANQIETLPPNLFSNLVNLESLRFIDNKITALGDNLFTGLRNLKIFHFNENQIESFGSHVFTNLKSLEELDLSHNKISLGPHGHFTSSSTWEKLKILNLAWNDIDRIPNGVKETMLNLVNFNISHNKLGPVLNLDTLNTFIQYNRNGDFVVDMSDNLIERIDLENNFSLNVTKTRYKLNITGNPIICDCTVTLLKTMIDGMVTGGLEGLAEIFPAAVRCSDKSPQRTRRKFLNEESLSYRDLNCPFPSKIIDIPCPEPCNCSLNTHYKETFMDCSNSGLTRFPSNLVVSQKSEKIVLDLSGNNIQNLSYAVARYKEEDEAAKLYQNISKLFLSRNQINEFHHFLLPHDLEELYLDNNHISEFHQSDINYFDSLVNRTKLRLKLGRNPYSCNCHSTPLYHFIKNRGAKVEDQHLITLKCETGEKQTELWKLKLDDFCRYGPPWYTNVIIVVLLILLLMAVSSVVVVVKREIIVIWVYSKPWGRHLFSEDIIDKDKPYDAFLSYAQADSDFVEKELLKGLECPEDRSEKYKCLIHTRDWNAGEMIPDQIMHSVESSRRTIIVLSKPYIQSMWTKLEFRAAHTQALQDKTQRVIIIVKGELPKVEEMEEDLQKYISLNTYLHAEDPWFWQKLRFALPHRGRMIKKRTRKETDKLELMRSQAELELGKRSPSPKSLDVKTLMKLEASGNTNVTNGHANGVTIGFVNN